MASNPVSVSPLFLPLELHGTACGETYVGIDPMHFLIWQVVFIFFLNMKNLVVLVLWLIGVNTLKLKVDSLHFNLILIFSFQQAAGGQCHKNSNCTTVQIFTDCIVRYCHL